MRDKRIKLIYFSLGGSEVKDIALDWKKLILLSSMLLIILIFIVGVALSFFTDTFDNMKISSLEKVNFTLSSQLIEMRKQINQVESRIQQLEGEDDQLRMIAGLDTIDQDMRLAGVGGPEYVYNEDLNYFSADLGTHVFETKDLIDQLKNKIQLLTESREEIFDTLRAKENEIKHLPTIKPVRIGRITSHFGTRIDPFTEQRTVHPGIDIGAPVGTPVFVSADGIVTRINRSYKKNKGYGKLVEIDHGNGLKTKYGHLDKIKVKHGQKVKRWEVIGEVGETGRATGPHLHYEVVLFDKRVNPIMYFFE
ncbi:MAG: peptidoglycan DD-metalloendopeptidase family protein [bacterium]|nr:peptidoglycan DD-metalloendopeptidase family protein [bacterium]